MFVVLIRVKVFGAAAVFEHILNEIVFGVCLVVHKLRFGVFIKEEKKNFNVTKK